MKKSTINYIIDIIIGLGFLASLITGIFLLFDSSGGYHGGRNNIIHMGNYFLHTFLHYHPSCNNIKAITY